MKVVLEPSLLFISESDWQDELKRDTFLEHLLNNLKAIHEHKITRIYWTTELEQVLWSDPQLPPWRSDRDWKLQIVPVINKLLRGISEEIVLEFDGICKAQPDLSCLHGKIDANHQTLRLIWHLLVKREDFYFCLGNTTETLLGTNFIFSCSKTDLSIQPVLIRKPLDWKYYIDVVNIYWPTSTELSEIEKFKKAIEITAYCGLSKDTSDFVYDYDFTEDFIGELINEYVHRKDVLYGLSKRLTLTQKGASNDGGLNDEPIKGKKGLRRMRVSGECRVHYKYTDSQAILFLNYYGEGKHDKGL